MLESAAQSSGWTSFHNIGWNSNNIEWNLTVHHLEFCAFCFKNDL